MHLIDIVTHKYIGRLVPGFRPLRTVAVCLNPTQNGHEARVGFHCYAVLLGIKPKHGEYNLIIIGLRRQDAYPTSVKGRNGIKPRQFRRTCLLGIGTTALEELARWKNANPQALAVYTKIDCSIRLMYIPEMARNCPGLMADADHV